MTPEVWSRVEQLFESALARPAEERAAFLSDSCHGDEALRSKVDALLAADPGPDEDTFTEIASSVAAAWIAEETNNQFVGQKMGRYEILGPLGSGGMGEVYLAYDPALDRKVALKLLPYQFTRDPDRLRRFEREARAASALNHPNIVPVYEIGESEGQHYFTMRLVPGGQTIAHWASEQRDEYRVIARAVGQVARAVAHAHERGILHRDLKPSNILWDPAGGPQVTDFGLAKVLAAADTMVTFSGQALGSPSYMAPEQMGNRNAEITTATDVYGVGAVLYELLAAKPPFAGGTALETMRRATEEAPQPIPRGPKDLRTICLKCLEKKQADRYRSAAALADDLERFVLGEPVSAVPLSLPQILLRWAARKPALAALLALLALSLVVSVAGISWQWQRTEAARENQAKTLAHLDWQEMARWARSGEEPKALAYLASQIRERPDNWPAAMYAMSIVDRRSMPMLAGPPIHPPSPLIPKTACLSSDGSWFVAAGKDAVVRTWQTASGRPVGQFSCPAPVTTLAVSDGPVKLAVATKDGTLTFGSSMSSEPKPIARKELSIIAALQFSRDGSALLARSTQEVEIWQTKAPNEPPRVFTLDRMDGAEISADGGRVLAWNANRAIVWDIVTGRELLSVSEEKGIARGAFSASGGRVAFIQGEYFVQVWDIASGRKFRINEAPLPLLTWLALDPPGDHLTVTAGSKVFIYDVASGLTVSQPMEHHYAIVSLRSSPDGNCTVSAGWDGAIHLWDARTGQSLMSPIEVGGSTENPETSPSRDGRMILVHLLAKSDRPESIAVWRGTQTREPQRRIVQGEHDFDAGRMSPDGRLGALGTLPGNRSYVFDLNSGRVMLDHALAGGVYVHLFSPDMRKCYAVTVDGWLYGWSLETGEQLWPPNQQKPGLVRPAAISPDGTRIIVGHNDGHIRVSDTSTGALVATLDHPGEIKVLRFAPDGSGRFVSASTDGLAHVWDLASGKTLQTFAGHTGVIISAAWSPDSRYLATASFDNTARVWEVATGRPVGRQMQHFSWLSHLEFSPDGQLLATACRDGTARLWHPLTGEPASPPLPQETTAETVRFTADGQALLVRDQDGFRFWDVKSDEPVTVHYHEPNAAGLGMDAENYRSIMSADGRRVFLGCAMNYGVLWSVSQPRGPAPAWFPDFLETLAGLKFEQREARSIPASQSEKLLPPVSPTVPGDDYAKWASQVVHADSR